MSTFTRSAVSLAASAVTAFTFGLAPGSASAVDFDGYFRAGPGAPRRTRPGPVTTWAFRAATTGSATSAIFTVNSASRRPAPSTA
jgi:maltoporin